MPAFLIKYNRKSGAVEVSRFESFLEATSERQALALLNEDPDLEIVAIASRDEESLRVSHSRYFAAV